MTHTVSMKQLHALCTQLIPHWFPFQAHPCLPGCNTGSGIASGVRYSEGPEDHECKRDTLRSVRQESIYASRRFRTTRAEDVPLHPCKSKSPPFARRALDDGRAFDMLLGLHAPWQHHDGLASVHVCFRAWQRCIERQRWSEMAFDQKMFEKCSVQCCSSVRGRMLGHRTQAQGAGVFWQVPCQESNMGVCVCVSVRVRLLCMCGTVRSCLGLG